MGAREAQFWRSVVRPHLLPYGALVRIENVLEEGTPDVNYTLNGVGGWIELKDLAGWPARADTVVRVPHYTPEQRRWHEKWCAARGRCFLLARVQGTRIGYNDALDPVGRKTPDEFFLFRGDVAAVVVGLLPRHAWASNALVHALGTFDTEEMVRALTT